MHPSIVARQAPDRIALRMAGSGLTLTYGELESRSNQLAQLFRSLGMRSGDVIAIMVENHPRYFEICWAAQRSGLLFTPLSTRLTETEAAYIVNDSGAKLFIGSRAFADVAGRIIPLTPKVHHRFMLDDALEGHASLEAAAARMPAEPIPDQSAGGDMLYSSGTTGRPKGVRVLPESDDIAYVTSPTRLCASRWGMGTDTVYLSPGPLYHSAPLRFSMRAMILGGTVVVMEHFDPVEFLRNISQYRVTHTQVVPTMFVRLLKLDAATRAAADVSSLRCAIHAAAPCPVSVKEDMIAWWGPILWEYYSGTEGMGMTMCDSYQWLSHKGTVGQSVMGRARICDEEGRELPAGEIGLVYFSDGKAFKYHNDPEKTAAARNALGWTTIGDIGYLDADAFLYLTDRKSFMIISGGVNIYPQESENVLVGHPQVMDAAVFGVPDADMGEAVKAVVQPRDMAAAGPGLADELIAYCRDRLAHYKCPRTVDFMAELPRSPSGKLYKRVLRDRYWEDHGQQRVA